MRLFAAVLVWLALVTFWGLWRSFGPPGGVVETVNTPDGKHIDALMILGLTDGVVDGDAWSGTVYAVGRYQYTTVMGAERTVLRFTVTRDAAREYVAKQQ